MNWGRLYLGGLIVAAGVIWLLDNAGTVDGGEVFGTWWPVAVILAGVLMLAANPGHWAVPTIVAAVGVVLLLGTLDVADLSEFIWPAVLVFVGLVVIFGRASSKRAADAGGSLSNLTIFSGSELASRSDSFEGGNVSVIFGGVELDLRESQLAPDATLDTVTVFGGMEVRVPRGWHVDLRGFPVFGAFENATAKEPVSPGAPVLTINATVLFGALEVKH